MATLATGLPARFGRAGFAPARFHQEVSPSHLRLLLFQAFPSAITTVGSVKTHFSGHLPGSVFSLTRNLFPATKVRARNRSMEPPRFHQPSIRSQPASGP